MLSSQLRMRRLGRLGGGVDDEPGPEEPAFLAGGAGGCLGTLEMRVSVEACDARPGAGGLLAAALLSVPGRTVLSGVLLSANVLYTP